MAKKQFYGIKYPFISQDEENYFIDLNRDFKSKIKSLLIHVIFTPKGQKIRDIEFGTNLVRYLYEPNDSETWSNVRNEIDDVVSRYIKGITINEVTVLPPDENRHDIFVRIDYTITNGIYKETDNLITKI
jgi:phage baseplate assembly protein W